MRTLDLGAVVLVYNFVVGVLLVLSSEKIASYAGRLGGGAMRYTHLSTVALGATVAALYGSVYLLFHVFRIGGE